MLFPPNPRPHVRGSLQLCHALRMWLCTSAAKSGLSSPWHLEIRTVTSAGGWSLRARAGEKGRVPVHGHSSPKICFHKKTWPCIKYCDLETEQRLRLDDRQGTGLAVSVLRRKTAWPKLNTNLVKREAEHSWTHCSSDRTIKENMHALSQLFTTYIFLGTEMHFIYYMNL